MKAEIQTVRS